MVFRTFFDSSKKTSRPFDLGVSWDRDALAHAVVHGTLRDQFRGDVEKWAVQNTEWFADHREKVSSDLMYHRLVEGISGIAKKNCSQVIAGLPIGGHGTIAASSRRTSS
jgi:hypothetical protein